jgi:phage gpG-like protein
MKPEELARRLSGDAFKKMRDNLLAKVLLTVLGKSQQRTPVRTGTLRRSETTRTEGNRGFVGTNVKYAPFVHEGTKFMAARPFFVEGIQDSRGEVERLAQRAGDAFFSEVAGG